MLESNFIRGFVLLIGFIGFGATTTSKGHTTTTTVRSQDILLPPCLPNDPNACGIK
jgi:hypothetical protein